MSRFLLVIAGAVVVLAGLQWAVPRWAASQIASRIAGQDGGVKPKVGITAMPFWILAHGQFQDLYIKAGTVHIDGVMVSQAALDWQNGQISLPALSHNKLVVQKQGHVKARIMFDDAALSKFLADQGIVQSPSVSLTPGVMTIRGRLTLGQLNVPLNAKGTLSVSSDKKAILFHPTNFDGIQLPVLTDLQIFQIDSLHLPLPMVIHSVTIRQNQLIVEANTP
jgi:hypothetical protein